MMFAGPPQPPDPDGCNHGAHPRLKHDGRANGLDLNAMTSRPMRLPLRFTACHRAGVLIATMLLAAMAATGAGAGGSFAQAQNPPPQTAPPPPPPPVPAPAPPPPPPQRIEWAKVNPRERQLIEELLASPDWPLRVFAMLRLERYGGEDVERAIRGRFKDDAWQVRCFALRQAAQMGYAIDDAELAGEDEPHVIRAAVRAGVEFDEAFLSAGAKKLMRMHDVELLLLGLEIAAASDIEELREEAQRRFIRIMENMDGMILARTSRRLAAIAGIVPAPSGVDEWTAWFRRHKGRIPLSPPVAEAGVKRLPPSLVAMLDIDAYMRLIDYLNFLKQRDLELVIVMDFTHSMLPMINQARAGVDSLIVFLNDISRTMRLGFVAYRDYDNEPVFEKHDFTQDVDSVRNFLFNVRITGGRDFPEAVLEGLTACGGLEWTEAASRQIIVVGDAPPHERDIYQVNNLVDSYRDREIMVHAVHVPMSYGSYPLSNAWFDQYNSSTGATFAEIAHRGGGRKVELHEAEQLVPSVMHFALEESWWPVFDEFYRLYLESCR